MMVMIQSYERCSLVPELSASWTRVLTYLTMAAVFLLIMEQSQIPAITETFWEIIEKKVNSS